jgi:hypothetical protein
MMLSWVCRQGVVIIIRAEGVARRGKTNRAAPFPEKGRREKGSDLADCQSGGGTRPETAFLRRYSA